MHHMVLLTAQYSYKLFPKMRTEAASVTLTLSFCLPPRNSGTSPTISRLRLIVDSTPAIATTSPAAKTLSTRAKRSDNSVASCVAVDKIGHTAASHARNPLFIEIWLQPVMPAFPKFQTHRKSNLQSTLAWGQWRSRGN